MDTWKTWKGGFDAWENATATWMEQVMKSPMLLGPAGAMLTAAAKAKAKADHQSATLWGQAGVAVKRDQERMLHEVHQLGSRMMDLEEQLAVQRDEIRTLVSALAERDAVLIEALQTVRAVTAAAQPTAQPTAQPDAQPTAKPASKKRSKEL